MITTTTLLLSLLASPASDPVPGPPPADDPGTVEVVYLANEGFLVRSSEINIVIDGFVKTSHKGYQNLTDEAYQALVSAEDPFDGPLLGLVSHAHRDHFQPRVAAAFLQANPKAAMAVSPQVRQSIMGASKKNPRARMQVQAVKVKDGGQDVFDLQPAPVKIHFMDVPHMGDADGAVRNYAHLIEIGDLELLHLGDPDAKAEHFADFGLEERDIDVAFVPSWFFASVEGAQIIDLINARHVVACHIPPSDLEMVSERMQADNPHVIVFQERMESKTFAPAD